MQEEALLILDDYRRSKEATDRHYEGADIVEQVWDEVVTELKDQLSTKMYEETQLQTNIEIFEDTCNNESTKVKTKMKPVSDVDLFPLRQASRERVEGLLIT